MIKKFSALLCVSAASLSLLAGCGKEEKVATVTEQVSNTGTQVTRQKTQSGLEYEIIQEGTGASPEQGKKVTVHYTGWLNDNGVPGTKFDSSLDRGTPFSFNIGKGYVIKGWDEGVMGMKIGEKRRLFIPANLAYGSRGAGAVIKPNSDLIFDVDLLEVN